jgi:hypothetical protein
MQDRGHVTMPMTLYWQSQQRNSYVSLLHQGWDRRKLQTSSNQLRRKINIRMEDSTCWEFLWRYGIQAKKILRNSHSAISIKATPYEVIIQCASKRALQLWELMQIYAEDMHGILNCHDVVKHTKFYLGYGSMWLSLITQGVSKQLYNDIPNVTIHRSRWWTMDSLYAFKCRLFRNTRHRLTFGIAL